MQWNNELLKCVHVYFHSVRNIPQERKRLLIIIFNVCVHNCKWRQVQRKNVVNNVDMSSLRAPWQNDPYKNKHTEQHNNTKNTKTHQTFRFVCVYRIFKTRLICTNENNRYVPGLLGIPCRQRRHRDRHRRIDLDSPRMFLPAHRRHSHQCRIPVGVRRRLLIVWYGNIN